MTATELLSLFETMPQDEQDRFSTILAEKRRDQSTLGYKGRKIQMPDFMARLQRIFPDGPPPGKPCSELIDAGRGEF